MKAKIIRVVIGLTSVATYIVAIAGILEFAYRNNSLLLLVISLCLLGFATILGLIALMSEITTEK